MEVLPANDTVTARVGLPLVVETLLAFGMAGVIQRELKVRKRASGFTEQEMVESFAMLLADGGECVADMEVLGADGGLCRLVGRAFPSADAAFDFLYAFHDNKLIAYVGERAERIAGLVAARTRLAALKPLFAGP